MRRSLGMTFDEVEADVMASSGTVVVVVVGEISVSSFDELWTKRAVRQWARTITKRCEEGDGRELRRRETPWSNDLPVA